MSGMKLEETFYELVDALEIARTYVCACALDAEGEKDLQKIDAVLAKTKEPSDAYKTALSDVAKMNAKGAPC